MRLLPLALALALAIALSAAAHVSAATPAIHCSNLAPRAELSCGHRALHQARSGLRWVRNHLALYESTHAHSLGFWRWRERVAERWIKQARSRLAPSWGEPTGSVPTIICFVFGQADCPEALHIAWRESNDRTDVCNAYGYCGLFQLGYSERATYATIGYSTAYEQTVAAHNLYLARGWEPWTCCGE